MIRKLEFVVIAAVIALGAFTTGADFLFFLLYLGVLVIGGSYILTRSGLSDLEAGYVVDRVHAQVGDHLRATYTIRNASRLPKPWLEIHSPNTLPAPLPGRAISLGSRGERSWVVRVPLTRRGHFRIEPMIIRTGDPFGLFESFASVGAGSSVIVYPRAESLPHWKLPPATLEGARTTPERTIQSTAMVTSIRPYVAGDAYNRIHWKSSARQQELQVKEFDLEQTADLWVFLDLDARAHTGAADEATVETAVRIAASIATRALIENRSVGFTASGSRQTILTPDRGPRQQQKVLQLLAAVDADGSTPFTEVLVDGIGRLRRGMTAICITPSLDRDWIRPLTTLRGRAIGTTVCIVDPLAHEDATRKRRREPDIPPPQREERTRAARAMQHALAEHDLVTHWVLPAKPLGEQIYTAGPIGSGVAA